MKQISHRRRSKSMNLQVEKLVHASYNLVQGVNKFMYITGVKQMLEVDTCVF